MNKCNICGAILTEYDSRHKDCGGDCLLCMATVADDADCRQLLIKVLLTEIQELKGKQNE